MSIQPDPELEKLLERAAENGAKKAFRDIGLDYEGAADDIRQMKNFLSNIRLMSREALKTISSATIQIILLCIALVLFIKTGVMKLSGF